MESLLIVGDSKGRVHSYKLSPNLRIQSKEVKTAIEEGELKEFKKIEVNKIKKILKQVVSIPHEN